MRFFLVLLAFLTGCTVIDTGHRGIKTEFGKIVGEPVGEGLYWYFPFYPSGTGYVSMNVQEQKIEDKTQCYTKDQQKATIAFALNVYPDPKFIHDIYRTYGLHWEAKNVLPLTLQAIKDVVGQTNANDLIQKREEAKSAALEFVRAGLSERHIILTSLSWTNIDFDEAYEKAVENKVVQIQKAQEAQNKTVQVTEEARQKVIAAEAEAKAMSIKSEALSKNQNLIRYEAVLKWNGQLPHYMMGSATPFIDLTNEGKSAQ